MTARQLFTLVFDPALPIVARREEIRTAVEAHPVVVVCGETGSGKSTQMPKILLESGRPRAGLIGVTQPRRIAARAIARRLAAELGSAPGTVVGHKVRFDETLQPGALVKVMTDGILLAEAQGDPLLAAYDTLLVDEAHERSVNIDLLLGHLKRLSAQRPELRVVIASATIDVQKFSRFFGGAPVIEVSDRLHPVEVRYRPVAGDAEDTTREEEGHALAEAVAECCRTGPGDILVFLPGEREIRRAVEWLRRARPWGAGENCDVLPLYARLAPGEQERVFHPGPQRRIVLATNVAETSLTVPRVRYVVDTGVARVRRYSYRTKVERLRVEPVSQASARQRAGRCGRVADGLCLRLYAEEDYARRPAYAEPELLRSSLAGVILRAAALGLGPIEEFPFPDPPPARAIADGYALLAELGAIDERRELTACGRELARLPLDPRIGRMLLAAREEGCLVQMLVIAAALSVEDPRLRPAEEAATAAARQARFADERSDFVALLNLWRAARETPLQRFCREHFLSPARMREWRDVHDQLARLAAQSGWQKSSAEPARAGGYAALHRALLAGLAGNVGLRDDAEGAWLGARAVRFWLHPASEVRRPGRWIVAAELVETTRLYARTVAAIDPSWIEAAAGHLLKRRHERPHWDRARAEVVAFEHGVLHGLTVYSGRRVPYGPHDPVCARKLFIRSGLVEGDYDTRASFFLHNRRLVAEIKKLEEKARRPDILVDEELLYAFYDARIPPGITNGADFERWRRDAERTEPRLLYLSRAELMRHEAAGITTEAFPHEFAVGANRLRLDYRFAPGAADDGVTLTVPIALLNQVPAERCEWLVPGMLREKVKAFVKALPASLRRRLEPLDPYVARFIAEVQPGPEPLARALARHVREVCGVDPPADAFRPDAVPAYLLMNFRVVGEDGRVLAQGRDLGVLKRRLAPRSAEAIRAVAETVRASAWIFGDLPESRGFECEGCTVPAWPALVDEGDAVRLDWFDAPEPARAAHRRGVRRLIALALREPVRALERELTRRPLLAPLISDVVVAALDRAFQLDEPPRTETDYARRLAEGRKRFALVAQELARLAETVLAEHAEVKKRIAAAERAFPQAAGAVARHCARLLAPGWLACTPWERLQHLPRYLRAAQRRLDKLREDPGRDARLAREIEALEAPWLRACAERARAGAGQDAALEQFGWLLEELRVSLWAQELRTPVPVSAKRLARTWAAIGGRRAA